MKPLGCVNLHALPVGCEKARQEEFFLFDTFADVDNTLIDNHVLSAGRLNAGGSGIIIGNELVTNAGTLVQVSHNTTSDFIRFFWRFRNIGNTMQFQYRRVNSSNFWRTVFTPAARTFTIEENNAGVFTTRATATLASPLNVGDIIEINVRTTDTTIALGPRNLTQNTSTGVNFVSTLFAGQHNLNLFREGSADSGAFRLVKYTTP